MPTENVLIQITTAANMAGLKEAEAGFLSLKPAILASGAALAGLVLVGKQAVDNANQQGDATAELVQAYATTKESLADYQGTLDGFLASNARFIADQYDVQRALANVVRSGLAPGLEAYRVLNDALDLSVIKHIEVSEAAHTITLAQAGNARGLRDLGITLDDYNRIMKSNLPLEERRLQLLGLIETKTKDGKQATSELKQSQQELNNEWRDITEKIGPGLIQMQKDIADAMLIAIGIGEVESDLMRKIGIGMTDSINSVVTTLRALVLLSNQMLGTSFALPAYLGAGGSAQPGPRPVFGRSGGAQSFDSGGTVQGDYPGQQVMVQAKVGEQFSMNGNGSQAPNEIHVHMHGMVIDGPAMDRFFQEGLRRARYAPGT